MLDLVVEGNAYLDGKLNKCCIGIENGKIAAIKKILKGEQHLDFGDKLILPAGIDAHVHFRDPGATNKEDFGTGTLAAAFGGISCILDMPNNKPPVTTKAAVVNKLERVLGKAHVDFGLFASVTEKTNIPATAQICTAFKIYLASTTGELLFSNTNQLPTILEQINGVHKVPAVHAEAENIIQEKLKTNQPVNNLHQHLRTRPNKAEAVAVANILSIAQQWINVLDKQLNSAKPETTSDRSVTSTSAKSDTFGFSQPSTWLNQIHLCHVSTAEAIKLICAFRGQQSLSGSIDKQMLEHTNTGDNNTDTMGNDLNSGEYMLGIAGEISAEKIDTSINNGQFNATAGVISTLKRDLPCPVMVTIEVTPHHLLLNESFKGGALGKVNPPLRTSKDQVALWEALANGAIDILSSDHAPHTLDDKSGEFAHVPAGLPGVETMLPLMLSYVKHNKLPLDRFMAISALNPARIFRLPKGRLALGYDGDLIVVNFYNEKPITVKTLHSKCGWTPYEKMDAIFPLLTVVRGNIIVKDGNLEVDPGIGKYYN